MKRYISKWISASLLGLAFMYNQDVYSLTDVRASYLTARQYDPLSGTLALRHDLISLLETRGYLLNASILGALHNPSQDRTDIDKENLLRNSHEIAKILSWVYGVDIGNRFEDLLDEHVLALLDYINVVKTGDEELANQIAYQAMSNGRTIAALLSRVSPYLPQSAMRRILDESVSLDTRQIDAYFRGNISTANQLRDASIVQLRELGNQISNAIQHQKTYRH